MRKLLLCVCILCFQLMAFSQKEWSNWYNNGNHLLTFKNGYPENITNFISSPPPVPPFTNIYHFYHWGQQGISYSNPVTGQMKFIISNRLGFGPDYRDFPNDTFIRSCPPDQQSYHIIPFTNNPDKFYVIQFESAVSALIAQETGLQVRCPNGIGLAYSIVDMSLNGGLGDISSINNVITSGLTEQIALVKHSNGQDVWIIVHPYNSSVYSAFLVSATGIQAPVTTNIGVLINGGSKTAWGTLTASHDGKLLAGCRSITPETGSESDIELFDFNNTTGILSNYRTMPSMGHVNKLCFSPDNTKLYAAGFTDNYNGSILNQWDFNMANVVASRTTISIPQGEFWDMQLAPDGKIYLSFYREVDANGVTKNYLPAIQCPNLPKYACNFKLRGFQVPYSASFPSLVNDFLNEAPVVPTPSFSIGNDTTICFGSFTLSAPSGWQSYQWNTGETTQSITVTQGGIYFVLTGNTGFSCPQGYGYIRITDGAIKLNLGRDTILCRGDPYSVSIPNQFTNIVWNNGSNTRDSVIYSSGTIIISVIDVNGCQSKDTLNVWHKYYPRAAFGADTTLCNNETILLRMEPLQSPFYNAVYLWQNSSTLDTQRITQPGTYWGAVTYQGCTMRDTITVQYINQNNFTLGQDTSLCAGDSLLITAPIANATYVWNNGETSQSIRVYNSGQYHVTVTNGLCSTKDTIQVLFQNRPFLFLGNDTTLCEGERLLLLPGVNGGNFLWQDGSTQPLYTVNTAGLYHLQYNINGCVVSDSIQVRYNNKPPVNLGSDTSFCAGGQLILQAGSPAVQSYLWQDQSTQPEFMVVSGGTYFVKVTGLNGCVNSDTVNIQNISPPIINLGNDTAICAGKAILLSVNQPQATFLWSTGSSNNQIMVDQAGVYWLSVSRQGCTATDSIVISINQLPVVNLGPDTTLCAGNSLLLNVSNANASYTWQDGSGRDYFHVSSPGLYHVKAINVNGCSNADSINVKYLPVPIVTLGSDTLLCPGQTITLTARVNTAVQYRWQDGSNFPSFNATDTGTFTLSVENICGTAKSSIIVQKGICQLYIPNTFTPNKDNLNDIFRIKYLFIVQRFQMSVYNKYGQRIFESADMSKGWDGNYSGLPQPAGAYVWVISFTDIDGISKILQGTILLLR